MDESKMTKKELKELRKRERMERQIAGGGGSSSKWIIIAVGTLIFLAFFGFIIYSIKQSKNKPVVLSNSGWVRGSENAKVKLTEFGDFQCPACKAYKPIVRKISKEFNGKILLTFKHFPLTSVHKNALLGARAAEAAGAQDKFWEMHDWLYDNQESWGELPAADAEARILEGAAKIGLDIDKFKTDINSKALENKILAQQNEGIDLEVAATPTFYLNNKKLDPTPKDYEEFKKVVAAELAKSK